MFKKTVNSNEPFFAKCKLGWVAYGKDPYLKKVNPWCTAIS